MAAVIDSLRQDHANLARLLAILDRQIAIFDAGGRPDYDIIDGVVEYCHGYSDERGGSVARGEVQHRARRRFRPRIERPVVPAQLIAPNPACGGFSGSSRFGGVLKPDGSSVTWTGISCGTDRERVNTGPTPGTV